MLRAGRQAVSISLGVRFRSFTGGDVDLSLEDHCKLGGVRMARIIEVPLSREVVDEMRLGLGEVNGHSACDFDFGQVLDFRWKNAAQHNCTSFLIGATTSPLV